MYIILKILKCPTINKYNNPIQKFWHTLHCSILILIGFFILPLVIQLIISLEKLFQN